MELSTVFGGDSLKASDLQGHEPTVIIANVEMKKFDNGNKLVITFEGKKKALVCNKTNANRIAYAFGSNTNNWIGQEVTLFTDLVDFQGKAVEAIRVRAKKPSQQQADAGQFTKPTTGPQQSRSVEDAEIPF